MFSLGVRFLMERAVASDFHNREDAEWPPHPDRFFMALVAAFGETGQANDEADALRWLEQRPHPPQLYAALDAAKRDAVTVFVPVNDVADPVHKKKPLAAMGSLQFGRIRQPRHYPAVVPQDHCVFLIWPDEELPEMHSDALRRLCAKATYLGHSSSPIQMWIESDPPEPNLVPTDHHASCRLRVFGPGRLEALRECHQSGQRPNPSLSQGYAPPKGREDDGIAESTFDDVVALRIVGGRRWILESTLQLGTALRNTLMSRLGQDPAPEWLSGHQADNLPSRKDHLAIVPLGFVGNQHADGHLLGLGLILPRDVAPEIARQLIDLLFKHDGVEGEDVAAQSPFIRLTLGQFGACDLELDDRVDTMRPQTLRPTVYSRPACAWATVTPMVLDRFPRRRLTAEDVVADACERAGLPRPASVRVGHAPILSGVPHSKLFPALPQRKWRPPRPMTHALIRFDSPVRGPILIGAGRYLGYGLCRPFECGYQADGTCKLPSRFKEQ